MHISKLDLLTSRFLFSTKVWRIYCLIKSEGFSVIVICSYCLIF